MPLTLVGRVAFAVVLGLRALVVSTRLRAEWCSAYASRCHDCIDGAAAVSTAREVAVYTARMSVPYQNSGVLRCWRRTVVSVPFLLLMLETLAIVGVACNTVFVLQSSSALVHSVMYNWRLNRLACLPSMLLTGVDALTVMVLPRVACMHHDPRLSYTRWQVSSCWC